VKATSHNRYFNSIKTTKASSTAKLTFRIAEDGIKFRQKLPALGIYQKDEKY